MELQDYFSPDDEGYTGYETIHGDTSEYGGGTYFKSNISQPDKDDKEQKDILLKAIETMRDSEVSRGKWSQLDDMWLEQRGRKWYLGENDGWSANDYFEVRVTEDGTPQVKVGESWQNITGTSSSIW